MRGIEIDSEKFRELRRSSGYTQEELAAQAACDVTTIRKAERGGRLDLRILGKLTDVLGVSFDDVTVGGSSLQATNTEVAKCWDDAFFARDFELTMSFHHPDIELILPSSEGMPGGGHFVGYDAVYGHMKEVFEVWDVFKQHSRQVHAVDDLVFIRGDASFRVAANGNFSRSFFLNELQLLDGLIIRRTVVADHSETRQALADE